MAGISEDFIGEAWIDVLDRLGEAVIVLDHQRTLRHVNDAARRLLGYEHGQKIGGRCRFTTRGVDCENACPLTFAVDNDLERVEDFATVYHTSDGRALPLRITVIRLTDQSGAFRGAVEILRPTGPMFASLVKCLRAAMLRERYTDSQVCPRLSSEPGMETGATSVHGRPGQCMPTVTTQRT